MVSIIVAYDKNRVIGKDGVMPWDIPEDMAHFKKLTSNNIVIMGRNTYNSIGKLLPNRINIILSRDKNFTVDGAYVEENIEDAFSIANNISKKENKEIFIIGGGKVYEMTIALADRLYVTLIDKAFDGDVYFPQINEQLYDKQITGMGADPVPYQFITYTKKNY